MHPRQLLYSLTATSSMQTTSSSSLDTIHGSMMSSCSKSAENQKPHGFVDAWNKLYPYSSSACPTFVYSSRFPPLDFNHTYAPPAPYRDPNRGYQVPAYFGDQRWLTIRKHPPIVLDKHFVIIPIKTGWTIFAEERDFLAVPWRLTLDISTFDPDTPPAFICGTNVNVFNLNSHEGQYVVDACHRICDEKAYLRVLWRDKNHNVGNPYHPVHPSFMLVVPQAFNKISTIGEQFRWSAMTTGPVPSQLDDETKWWHSLLTIPRRISACIWSLSYIRC